MKFHTGLLFKGFLPLSIRNSIENTVCLVGSDIFLQILPESFARKEVALYMTGFTANYLSQLILAPFDDNKNS